VIRPPFPVALSLFRVARPSADLIRPFADWNLARQSQ
jgi:hypothetical protein